MKNFLIPVVGAEGAEGPELEELEELVCAVGFWYAEGLSLIIELELGLVSKSRLLRFVINVCYRDCAGHNRVTLSK